MGSLPQGLTVELAGAYARVEDGVLVIGTDVVERRWRWTGEGLATVSIKNTISGREWVAESARHVCDWAIGDVVGAVRDGADASLASLSARAVTDDPWTSDHVEVRATVDYAVAGIGLQYVVAAYPSSPGMRTQLRLKSFEGALEAVGSGGADVLPVAVGSAQRRAIGYYNQTQQRNSLDRDLLRDEVFDTPLDGKEVHDWASLLCLEDGDDGLCFVKESHKCVNQKGVDTGEFVVTANGVASTGLGPAELTSAYRDCWANWLIVYTGDDLARETSIKAFDRARYPIDPERDIYVMANTWGSTDNKQDAQEAAREENVLREIDSQADLGIDVQQIDDGWQGNDYNSWRPVVERYPEGWKNVRAFAKEKGVTLGLWSAWSVGAGDLTWNFDHGGFRYYKIDFANLKTYDQVETLMGKARRLIEHSGHTARVNWDVTENPARVGYFFAREFGNIYLENRKPRTPESVVYRPHLVLRDAWQVSRYINLSKFQVSIQNPERVNREVSDAYRHSHEYTVAIALMGAPIFFQETHYYDEEARAAIRPILAVYKQHREAMFGGTVYPIGAQPNNASWTGFQCHLEGEGAGYLTVFREIENANERRAMRLNYLAGKAVTLTDLLSCASRVVEVGADGAVEFSIEKPADFRFLRYTAV